MDPLRDPLSIQRHIFLDDNKYGHWKVKMGYVIRSIDEDAWTAVENGLKEPVSESEDGKWVPKLKELWTDEEKILSKMKSKAVSAIFYSLSQDQFKQVQDCTTAKEAWDTLQLYYEGTTNVRRSRLDALASQFKNLRIDENERVTEFSAKISAIASETNVIGKKHKDKKLVKMFRRCLLGRVGSHLSAMNVALNTDTNKFGEVVGMIKAHEMDQDCRTPSTQKGIALTVSEDTQKIQELENAMTMMVKKFDRTFKRLDKGSRRSFMENSYGESEKSFRRT